MAKKDYSSYRMSPILVTNSNVDYLKHLDSKLFPVKWNEDHYHNLVYNKKQYGWLFFYKKKLIGTATFKIHSDAGYIMSLGVKKRYRRRGLGTSILMSIENFCRMKNMRHIMLHTPVDDKHTAHKFYLKNKYKIVKINYTFYDGSVDPRAYLLYKRLWLDGFGQGKPMM